MSDWRGRGKGRPEGQASPEIKGGPGKGGGRPGSQPSLSITGGPGKGGGRPGSQVSLDITGGAGRGGGRGGSQPSLAAKIDFGGDFKYTMKGSPATGSARAETSIGTNTGPEKSPRVADPEGNFMFYLVLGGSTTPVAQFKEASGLKSSTAIFEIEEGGMNHRVHKLPGQSRWDNIVLRYGVSSDTQLAQWRNEILSDEFAKRKSGSIVMMTTAGEEVRRYNFTDGWPVAWEGPHFAADSAEVAVEMVEIAHSGIQIT